MYPSSVRDDALSALRSGESLSAVSRKIGVSRSTPPGLANNPGGGTRDDECPRCSSREIDPLAYAALLGFYLGDGCLSEHPRYFAFVSPVTPHFLESSKTSVPSFVECVRA